MLHIVTFNQQYFYFYFLKFDNQDCIIVRMQLPSKVQIPPPNPPPPNKKKTLSHGFKNRNGQRTKKGTCF